MQSTSCPGHVLPLMLRGPGKQGRITNLREEAGVSIVEHDGVVQYDFERVNYSHGDPSDLVTYMGITMYRFEVEQWKKKEGHARNMEAAVDFLRSLTEEYDSNPDLIGAAVVRDDIYDLYMDWLDTQDRMVYTDVGYFEGIELHRVKNLPVPGQMLSKGLTPRKEEHAPDASGSTE